MRNEIQDSLRYKFTITENKIAFMSYSIKIFNYGTYVCNCEIKIHIVRYKATIAINKVFGARKILFSLI